MLPFPSGRCAPDLLHVDVHRRSGRRGGWLTEISDTCPRIAVAAHDAQPVGAALDTELAGDIGCGDHCLDILGDLADADAGQRFDLAKQCAPRQIEPRRRRLIGTAERLPAGDSGAAQWQLYPLSGTMRRTSPPWSTR